MENNRYQRQILLHEIGETGQQKLLNAKVLVVGAGGLGCSALQYLTAAGIGTIGIVDYDVVELTNLQRQTLYATEDIGKLKVDAAVRKLYSQNPDVTFKSFRVELTTKNALEIFSEFDIIMDGTDNFQTRYLINDACVILKKTLIYGAVLRFEGQVGVFNHRTNENKKSANYRDLFPNPPDSNQLSCNDVGVLGVVPGIIGMCQANEIIKIITGIGEVLSDKIMMINFLDYSSYVMEISPINSGKYISPITINEFQQFNYEWFCSSNNGPNEIDINRFLQMINSEDVSIVDVREESELPKLTELNFIGLPMSRIEKLLLGVELKQQIIVICHSGIRSQKAAKIIHEKFPMKQVSSLKGGLSEWQKYKNKMVSNNE